MQSSTKTTQNAGGSQACAVCKYQRRKCTDDCLLAPFFPANRNKEFLNTRKLFGVRNITKLIKNLNFQERAMAIKTITFESNVRACDPVGGCYRFICELQKQHDQLRDELNLINQSLALCKAQLMFNQNQQQSAQKQVVDNEEEQVNVGVGENQNWEGFTMFDGGGWSAYDVFDSNMVKTEIELSSNVDEDDDGESLLVNELDATRDSSLGFDYEGVLISDDVGEDIKPLLPFLDYRSEKSIYLYLDSDGRSKIQNSDKLVSTERAGSSIQHQL